MTDARPRIAYFTAGTVGAGHAVRGEAIRRGLQRRGFAGSYRVFGPSCPFELGSRTVVDVKGDPALADPARAARSSLGEALRGWQPDLLIADMFWAPLRHVLPHLDCPAWLLLRACPSVWLQGNARVRFHPGAWDRIVEIEPLGLSVATHRIDPVVLVDPDECEPAGALKARLGVAPDSRLCVVMHAGAEGELRRLEERAPAGCRVVSLDLHAEGLFPAAAWLGGADEIVAGAGYNSFWEAHWLGYAPRCTFVPFERSIDRQSLRVDVLGGARPASNGANTLAEWIGRAWPGSVDSGRG